MLRRVVWRAALPFMFVLANWPLPARGELIVRELAPGIYYGAAPESAADYRTLKALGVKTIVELRKFWHGAIKRERIQARRFGFAWRHVPIGFYPLRDGGPERVLRIVTAASRRPVYFHCNLGRDRAGLIVALYRVRFLGWSSSAAFSAMKRQQYNPKLKGLDDYFWSRCWRGFDPDDLSFTAKDESKELTAAAAGSPAHD